MRPLYRRVASPVERRDKNLPKLIRPDRLRIIVNPMEKNVRCIDAQLRHPVPDICEARVLLPCVVRDKLLKHRVSTR